MERISDMFVLRILMWRFRTYLVLPLCGVLASGALAASPNSFDVVAQGTPHQALFGLDFRGSQGLAVGAAGAILQTRDGGQSWTAADQNLTRSSLFDVSIGDEYTYAVGQMGSLLKKQASGDWELMQLHDEMRLLAVDQNAAGMVVVVGQFGIILQSQDHGASWVKISPDWSEYVGYGFEPQLYDVHVDSEGKVTVVGEFGLVLRTVDAGETWKLLRKGKSRDEYESAPSIWAMTLSEKGIGYAVGQQGLILKTADGGDSWQETDAATTANLQGVYADAIGNVFAVGIRELLSSRDSGQTWQRLQMGDISTAWYQTLSAPAGNKDIYAVGHSGRVVRIR